jgi:dTDP-4-dehydrorhamnose reductase
MENKMVPSLWGGIESTVNRVGDLFYDQTVKSGHQERIGDLQAIAELGIKTLRYPALIWERVAPDGVEKADWRWPDQRLKRLRKLGIKPVVGFLHHGSGPRYTSLVDPDFPSKLEVYATAVIRRYPDLELFTPINEMMTTARFSALYGHWYPHQQNGLDFMCALFNQCHATVLAMDAVRRVNSAAKFVSTEDVGKTYATPELQYQADFDNDRRWWSYDILCGRFNMHHPAWHFAEHVGMDTSELKRYEAVFDRDDIAPDIMGVNYYVTGERWLDHRVDLFPEGLCGGNGRHQYVDTEAVRVRRGMSGVEQILQEVWERYYLPVAITEAHLSSTVDEQMCWFKEVWDGARKAKEHGIDVRAVTVWALLGLYDWDSLVTQNRGRYEPGLFDLSSGVPESTRYTEMIQSLATNKQRLPEALNSAGWWRQEGRILYEV